MKRLVSSKFFCTSLGSSKSKPCAPSFSVGTFASTELTYFGIDASLLAIRSAMSVQRSTAIGLVSADSMMT
jgi:hypothetical protein